MTTGPWQFYGSVAGTGSDPGGGAAGGMDGQEGLGQTRAPTAYLAFCLSMYLSIYVIYLSIYLSGCSSSAGVAE